MRHVLTLGMTLLSISLAAPLTITPSAQVALPGSLVILSASEEVNWTTTGGALGSTRGTRIVLEAPRNGGNITVTAQDPKDVTRKAFAVVQISTPAVNVIPWRTHTFAAGASFSAAVSPDGSLWTWGLNSQSQIPGGKTNTVTVPLRTEGISNLMNVGTSRFRDTSIAGIALAKNGTLWSWGENHKTLAAIDKNVAYVDYSTCLVVSAGDGTFSSSTGNGRTKNDAKQVAYVTSGESKHGGGNSLMIFRKDGTVAISPHCDLGSGEAIVIDGLKNVIDVTSVFEELYIALRNDGSAVLINNSSERPEVQELAGFTSIRTIASSSKRGGGGWGFVITNDGMVRGFELDGSNIPTVPKPVAGLSDMVDVSVSGSHALFLRKDGTLFALGLNNDGELGNGTTQDSDTPVQVTGLKVAVH